MALQKIGNVTINNLDQHHVDRLCLAIRWKFVISAMVDTDRDSSKNRLQYEYSSKLVGWYMTSRYIIGKSIRIKFFRHKARWKPAYGLRMRFAPNPSHEWEVTLD